MTEYTFKKGDTGTTRGGDRFEVVAEYKSGISVRRDAIAVIFTHRTTNNSQTLHTMYPHGKWREGAEHHHDLLPPTEKSWVVRAEYINAGAKSVQFEYGDECRAKNAYDSFSRLSSCYRNITITEIDVPIRRG